jgi:DNA polymerase III delta prime subunit
VFSDKLNGQDFALRVLRAHVEGKRMSHAYMLTGALSPKAELAMALACTVNCEKTSVLEECDCYSCRKTQAGTHPDAHILGADPKVRSIKIEEIRTLLQGASLKPYEGRWKVFMLLDAGRMTADASNALLKTLEEPPSSTLLILTAESSSQFMETIRSRCFEVRMRPNSSEFGTQFSPALSGKNWEDLFEEYAAKSRDDLKTSLDSVLQYLRRELQAGGTGGYNRVRALELILESKDALESNVNQKLLMTRLAVHFRRLSPEKAST